MTPRRDLTDKEAKAKAQPETRGGKTKPRSRQKAKAPNVMETTQPATRTLSLMKGREHFCFRYEVGQEAQVLHAMIDMVHNRELCFDWFDAAVLSHQLGQHLAKELQALLPKQAE